MGRGSTKATSGPTCDCLNGYSVRKEEEEEDAWNGARAHGRVDWSLEERRITLIVLLAVMLRTGHK